MEQGAPQVGDAVGVEYEPVEFTHEARAKADRARGIRPRAHVRAISSEVHRADPGAD